MNYKVVNIDLTDKTVNKNIFSFDSLFFQICMYVHNLIGHYDELYFNNKLKNYSKKENVALF